MGLFGDNSAGASPAGKHGFDWGAAAAGFLGVPASVFIARRQRQEQARQAAQIDAWIADDPDLTTPGAKAFARAFPQAYAGAYLKRLLSRQPGPASGPADEAGQSGAAPPPPIPTPAAGPGRSGIGPSDEAVSHLRQFRDLAPHFDLKFGPGAASQFLGNGSGGGQYPF